jgi:TatD DNase family protein
MKYIDTHAHLSSEFYKSIGEVKEIYQKSVDVGVQAIINVATNMTSSRMVIADKAILPLTYPAVGIHPLDIEADDVDFAELETLASKPVVVGIGEIGLDLYHKTAPSIEKQKVALMKQFDIALRVSKPVIIHVRDAFDELFEVLEMPKYAKLKGLIHTFSGNVEQAKKLTNMGFKLSFSGVITFKNAEMTRKVIASIPSTSLLSETDSPFLTPVPKRGQRNYPLNVIFVVAEMAKICNISVNEMVNVISKNADELFGIK